ncbi:hypothetical protein HGA92_00465 [Candidatus Gracilibacteria bacterium]|nr:hypothetical protein [Candidatus Gracilibacteria bacterium]NUJ98918.1 hypothetical protein [Candidatus Gracilibacteria bacterium]
MFENEKVLETKICKHCGVNFDITDKDLEFYEKVSPVFPNPGVSFSTPGVKLLENGKIKYLIPSPTLCPDCRQQRRLSFRNEKTITFRTCDLTGKRIFSMYSPDKPYKVYHYEDWFSDKWNPFNYARDFDFSRSFFEQFHDLDISVPKMSLSNLKVENSDFVSQVGYCKNCYLIFNAEEDENCYYGKDVFFSRYCVDSFGVGESEQCYYCIRCIQCFYVEYGMYSYNCRECKYIFSCIGCKNCIGCVNLNNSEYCIFNKRYSKEEYFLKIETLSSNQIKKGYDELLQKSPRNYLLDVKNSENILGDLISGSKNIYQCFQVAGSKDIRYSTNIVNSEDIMDVNYFGINLQKSYESSVVGHGNNLNFCFDCWDNVSNLIYCFFCINGVKNCFGCVGLHSNEQYCILNKQYTKEEYEKLVPKIIEHMMTPPQSPSIEGESGAIVKQGEQEWGEFFPSSLSPFGYNETVAQEYYPINPEVSKTGLEGEINYIDREGNIYNTLEEAGKRPVFKYSTYEAPFPKVEKIIPASKLPENIADIPDNILNWAIECEVTKKPFRIIKEELSFYRKHNLPIPRRHPDQRHLDRMSLRNPRKLFERICDCLTCEENHKNIGKYKEEEFEINIKTGKKGKKIQTTYAPEREEIVYCEECYNKEVY